MEEKIVDERIERAQQAFNLWSFLGLRKGGLDKQIRIVALKSFILGALEYSLGLLDECNLSHTKKLDSFIYNSIKKTYGLKGPINCRLLLRLLGRSNSKEIITQRQKSINEMMSRSQPNEIGFQLLMENKMEINNCLDRVKKNREKSSRRKKEEAHWTMTKYKNDQGFEITKWRCLLYLLNRFPGVGSTCLACSAGKINHLHYKNCTEMATLRNIIASLDELVFDRDTEQYKGLRKMKSENPSSLDMLIYYGNWSDVIVRTRLKFIMNEMSKMCSNSFHSPIKRDYSKIIFFNNTRKNYYKEEIQVGVEA